MKKILKQIYFALPFKYWVFNFIRQNRRVPPKFHHYLRFTNKKFEVKIGPNQKFKIKNYGNHIENELFWNGINKGWEKESLKIWKELCQTSDVILDVGANTGVYSLVAKAANPESRVIAFEPVKRTFDRLEHNNNINGFDIECFNSALSNFDGKATMYDYHTDNIYTISIDIDFTPNGEKAIPIEVKANRLDTIIEKLSLDKIDLLKIDVETHEPQVLEGFSKYIKKFKPNMIIEILDIETAQRIEEIVHEIEYTYFNINENIGLTKMDRLSKSDSYNFLLIKTSDLDQINNL